MVWEVGQGAGHLWISVMGWFGLGHGCLGLHHAGTLYIYYVGSYWTDSRTLKIVMIIVKIRGGHPQIRWNSRARVI